MCSGLFGDIYTVYVHTSTHRLIVIILLLLVHLLLIIEQYTQLQADRNLAPVHAGKANTHTPIFSPLSFIRVYAAILSTQFFFSEFASSSDCFVQFFARQVTMPEAPNNFMLFLDDD